MDWNKCEHAEGITTRLNVLYVHSYVFVSRTRRVSVDNFKVRMSRVTVGGQVFKVTADLGHGEPFEWILMPASLHDLRHDIVT